MKQIIHRLVLRGVTFHGRRSSPIADPRVMQVGWDLQGMEQALIPRVSYDLLSTS